MRNILFRQTLSLALVSLTFFSYAGPAAGGINIQATEPAVVAFADMTQNSQALQSVMRTADAENRMMRQMKNGSEIKNVLDSYAASMDTEYWNLVIAQVNDYVNVRSAPNEDGEVLGKLYNNSVGEFLSEENGWYQISSGSVTGYVKAEYCLIGSRAAERARILLENDADFSVAESKEEEAARLLEEKKKKEAKRQAELEAARKAREASAASTVVTVGDSDMGAQVAQFACQFVGNPYKWGGTSLTEGADCSGFVMSVYANFGVELPHSSKADRKVGYDVGGLENAIPGDIICYSGHVAIYIGDGQIVHASTKKTGIIISNADYKPIICVRRIF